MSLTVTSNYQTAHDSLQRTPVYKATFARSGEVVSTHTIGSTDPYMMLPQGVATEVDPEAGRSSIGSTTIVILDRSGYATDLIGRGIGGDKVTMEMGFIGLDAADYADIPGGIVESYRLTDDLTGYEIVIRDPQALTNKQIFEVSSTTTTAPLTEATGDTFTHYLQTVSGKFQVTNTLNAATFTTALDTAFGVGNWSFYATADASVGSTITVTDTTFFRSAGYLILDKEIIQYTGKTATTFTGLTRASKSTTATVHLTGTTVQEMIVLGPDHPMDIIRTLYTRTDKAGLSIDHNYEQTVLANTPSLYLRLGEATGTNADDISGNNLDGTYVNTPTLSVQGAIINDGDTSITLTAASSEYLTVADNALLDPGDTFTIEAWVKKVAGVAYTICDKGTDGYQLHISAGGLLQLSKTGTAVIVSSTTAISNAVWTHVVATKATTTVKLYINGVDRTDTVTNQTIVGTATALNIGRTAAGAGYFDGSMDEFALYPTALSATQVLAHYTAGTESLLIDDTEFIAAKTSLGDYQMEFRITSRMNAKDFLEQELFRPLSAYPVTRSGKLSIVLFAEPAAADSVATIDHDSIITDGDNVSLEWDGNFASLVNKVTVLYDWNPLLEEFQSSYEDEDPLSIAIYGEKPLVIESQGFRKSLTGTDTFIAARVTAYLDRYGNAAPIVTTRTHLQKNLIEVGDIISLTSALLPNRYLKTRGITAGLFEVIKMSVLYAEGVVEFDLLWTSFSLLASDDFNRANTTSDNDPDLDRADLWTCSTASVNTPRVLSNQLLLGESGAVSGENYLRQQFSGIGPNQISELEFSAQASGKGGPAVRMDTGGGYANGTCYAAVYEPASTRVQLWKFLGQALTSGTQLGSNYTVTLVAGDRLRIHASGTTITVLINDVAVITVTDSAITSGVPGAVHTSATGTITFDNWRGGDDGWA